MRLKDEITERCKIARRRPLPFRAIVFLDAAFPEVSSGPIYRLMSIAVFAPKLRLVFFKLPPELVDAAVDCLLKG